MIERLRAGNLGKNKIFSLLSELKDTEMFDPKQMQAFVVLAENMHFGKTAKVLGISQSTLSMQIRSLEEEIGGALINRSNRTMTLTTLGETFLTDAQNILAMMECAKKNNKDILDGTVSSLRLGVDRGTISSGIFDAILAESQRRFPQLELCTTEEPPVSLLKALSAGKLDALVTSSYGLEIPKNIVTYTLTEWRAMLVASERYALQNPMAVSILMPSQRFLSSFLNISMSRPM